MILCTLVLEMGMTRNRREFSAREGVPILRAHFVGLNRHNERFRTLDNTCSMRGQTGEGPRKTGQPGARKENAMKNASTRLP